LSETAPDVGYGDVGSKKLYEDDRCIVWEFRLAPGEISPVHRHERDYIMLILGGDRIAAHFTPDSVGVYKDLAGKTYTGDVEPGTVKFGEKGSIEAAENIGSVEYLNYIVEFKH
jgi:hypothetical protein